MSDLVARTGRHQQRYENGYRLIAGCIPFKYRSSGEDDESSGDVEVLMINSTSGPGLLFPKGGWENDETVEEAAIREAMEEAGVRGDLVHFIGNYEFKSKTLQDEFSPEGLCNAAMYALHVKEELDSWPEQSVRHRSWLAIPDAIECCRHKWMREALEEGFSKWRDDGMTNTMNQDHVERKMMLLLLSLWDSYFSDLRRCRYYEFQDVLGKCLATFFCPIYRISM